MVHVVQLLLYVKILCFFFSFVVQYTIKLDDYMPGKDVNFCHACYDVWVGYKNNCQNFSNNIYVHRNQKILFISFLYYTFRVKTIYSVFCF